MSSEFSALRSEGGRIKVLLQVVAEALRERALAGIGRKPWLIVSNNRHNRNLQSVLAVRITTTGRYAGMPTVVTLTPSDPLAGHVVCDDLWPVYRDEITQAAGALARRTMLAVNDALKVSLALP